MVLTLLKQAIEKNAARSSGFLIDGYPRELDQGKRFEAEVAPVERVIYFQVRYFLSVFSCLCLSLVVKTSVEHFREEFLFSRFVLKTKLSILLLLS